MAPLVIDREPLPGVLLSGIGAKRVPAEGGAEKGVLTPEAEAEDIDIDECDTDDIDPDDYPDTTAYLNAIPGMAEYLIKMKDAPASEFTDVPEEWFSV